ncbi:hypothetical protein BDP27DRAFT_1398020 [Rhodocollybia butyracea]|uniref:Uncharacterized protein n=1 Tax=Rhodocollybia butyracea TaxID=206335 RepID=A0A9P5Q282_9AGAR|nr:hypothetical protein BDP27DRAFT_1398020 [Rhodocollybia butyracea]
MPCEPPLAFSSRTRRMSNFGGDSMYRMRSPSAAESSCSDDSSYSSATSSSDSIRTISASSSSSSLCEQSFYPERYSEPKYGKPGTRHVLLRGRNANVPLLYRHNEKKTSGTRRRETGQDFDYEPTESPQRPKKQKTKSSEQLEAEEIRMLKRKAELEEDCLLDASRMRPDRVWCIPCNKYIQIDSRRQYYATLWYKHRGKRHAGESSRLSGAPEYSDMDVDSEGPRATSPPAIDDAFASMILADMYSKANGLRLLSLAAAASG